MQLVFFFEEKKSSNDSSNFQQLELRGLNKESSALPPVAQLHSHRSRRDAVIHPSLVAEEQMNQLRYSDFKAILQLGLPKVLGGVIAYELGRWED